METKILRWCQYACLIIGLFGIILGPWIFTSPNPFGMHSLDFSQTGDIGDTIGGITAPFVGFVSILLLWWTLKEQQAFNDKQLAFNDEQQKINEEQKRFNDANRILSMETHILHLNDNLHYGITEYSKDTIKCNGVSELKQLYYGTNINIGISSNELEKTVNRVHIIETAVSSLISLLDKSRLTIEEKKASYVMAETFLIYIRDFYSNVVNGNVNILLSSIQELHSGQIGEKRQDDLIKDKCLEYCKKIKEILSECQQKCA